jgi:hypothetical protein
MKGIVLLLCLLFGVAAAETQQRGGRLLPVPPGAQPIATTAIDEVRGFAEMGSTSAGREFTRAQRSVDVDGNDTLYQTERSYGDIVAFFDQAFKQPGFVVLARTVTLTATAWSVRRPDHALANLVVRQTTPQTTFEIAEPRAPAVPQIR